MPADAEDILKILELEPLERNLYRGISPNVGWQRVFGGQVIAQALVAAQSTVDSARHVHSLHGYFMRPGDPTIPIIYEVDRIRDGGSFTTRRVVAIQHGHAIFSMSASFQKVEEGLEHQMPMSDPLVSDLPMPEDLPSEKELAEKLVDRAPESIRKYWERKRAIELRPTDIDHFVSNKTLDPHQNIWIRATGDLPDDLAIHSAVLAYASDMTLLDTSLYPHGRAVFDPELQVASLDHAIWFHRPFKMEDWHIYMQDSPSTSGARGFARGRIYTREGVLVASTAQEGLIRPRSK